MPIAGKLILDIRNGDYDPVFRVLYGPKPEQIAAQRQRYTEAIYQFEDTYESGRELELFSVPGRTEIGGNHTDHNHGIVLAAAVNLDIIAVVAKNAENIARVRSQGFPGLDTVDLSQLQPVIEESGRSAGLIRGVAAGIAQRGGVVGGFDAYTTSNVLPGSGLSSSAAFEVCMGAVLNGLYNHNRFSPVQLGLIGQRAENLHFGKPSGLMDQTACAVGSAITIDLKDPRNPVVEKLPFDLAKAGFALVITDTRGNHANLTGDYAAIRREMESVAGYFGKNVLRELPQDDLMKALPQVRAAEGDRAVLRALHFYAECERVKAMARAITRGDMEVFLQKVVECGHSSFEYNQNAYSPGSPEQQDLPVALALSQTVLNGRGAWRLQGGGFAGTIQAFVPDDLLDDAAAAEPDAVATGADDGAGNEAVP